MCGLTIGLLPFPGTAYDSLWRLNPEPHSAFQSFGGWAIVLMLGVGLGCALGAIGLWNGAHWGVPLAVLILSVNILGDLINVLLRHDYVHYCLPVGGAMIIYLSRARGWRSGS